MSGTEMKVPSVASPVTDLVPTLAGKSPATISNDSSSSTDRVTAACCGETKGRRGIRRPLAEDFEYSVAPTKKKSKSQKTEKEDVEVEFETEWICCECKEAECQLKPEATDMLVCDGPCRRLVHYPCAGLNKLPSDDEEFYCNDCVKKRHMCMICAQYGDDDKDIFLCSNNKCGLFFHESCLDMQNIKVEIFCETEKEGSLPRRVFVCPAHSCWTCTQTDLQGSEINETEGKTNSEPNKSGKKQRKRPKGQKDKSKVFESKGDSRLLRCMECSISYHASCIPPSAKFHELALLCHQHAESRKLPELDKEASIQRALEQRAETLVKTQRSDDSLIVNTVQLLGDNVFFCGIEGANPTSQELRLASALDFSSDDNVNAFCLPCDIKHEVHSKPPNYKHVNSLQYQPGNRPPLLPQAGDLCGCDKVCDERCINRTLYMECFGDRFKLNGVSSRQMTNCSVGGDCGNRKLGQRQIATCQPSPEEGRGWGLVALQQIKEKDLVIEYVGEVIDEATKEQRLIEWSKEHPNDTNFYIMALQPNWYIDARFVANTARFINHSCDPNCILLPINVGGCSRCGIFALRDIEAGEYLSYDYHFDTKQTDRFVCCCGASNCRGTMQEKSSSKELVGDTWELAKAEYQRDKKFLESRQLTMTSLVSSYVPAATIGSKDEFVGNGPQKKHFRAAQQNQIFLARNAVLGFNCFAQRLGNIDDDIVGSDSN